MPAHASAVYRGRFAPTPSGPLHLGSLTTAVASWLDARQHGGHWLLRIDDLDPPREVPGAADTIRQQLEQCGLHWDGPVIYQSQRQMHYTDAVEQLLRQGDAFRCALSRKDLAAYPGGHPGPSVAVTDNEDTAVRLAVPDEERQLVDACAGAWPYNLQRLGGAFVIRRRDGLFAYQLACAVDDAAFAITHVLRGDDLLPSTPQQCYVLERLGLQQPRYAHIPVIRDAAGEKLSKSAGSARIDASDPAREMARALAGLALPHDPQAPAEEQLARALSAWQSPFGPAA
jgi:glutamyl-Q tRNA(Asp) synthetase